MLTTEKRKEFEALAADPESRALLETLLSQAEATVKAADDAGAVYKDAPAWAQALISRLDALEATVKAPMPPAEMVEAGETELADGEAELDAELAAEDGAADDMMDDEGFAQLIVDKLLTALGPLLELEKKMAGWAGEIKAALPQAMAQKDDAVAAIDARVKALEGDQPRAARQHYAAGVWEGLVGQTVTKEQAAALAARAVADAPAGLSAAEAGAYKLIFGE
jgi:hypothetical protein